MKWMVFIVALMHGLIHLTGFIKGFGLIEVKELTQPISKPLALVWLLAAILFLLFAIAYITEFKYTWICGLLAVSVSQLLIFMVWKDALYGTIPNITLLIVSLALYGSFNFQSLVNQETEVILSQNSISVQNTIVESDLEHLPMAVQNWLRTTGIVGLPTAAAGRVEQKAEMKMKPEQKKWMKATAVQYSTINTPAFIWNVDVKMNPLLHFKGRDKFANGKGEMLIKLNSLVTVVNEKGEKLDEGTLQRYLGEMVWFPWLALSEHIRWESIGDTVAKATMHYKGLSASGTFYFSATGDVASFSALRFMGNDAIAGRYLWIMNIQDYSSFQGIRVPSKMTSTWKLDEGDWTWLKLEVTNINYFKS